MGWFRNDRKPDIWEVADDRPVGDIEAAQKIRNICASAGTVAENLAAFGGPKAEEKKAVEAERYQAALKRALEIAMQISDDPMRDVSVSQIISLCVKAGHLKTARVLVRAIQSDETRAELIAGNPALVNREATSSGGPV